jgi:hypothetical protein
VIGLSFSRRRLALAALATVCSNPVPLAALSARVAVTLGAGLALVSPAQSRHWLASS